MKAVTTSQRRFSGGFTAGVVISALLTTPTTYAAWPDTSAFDGARELSDRELNAQRGRFIDRDKIIHFGVEMTSRWKTASGKVLQAEAQFKADMSGKRPEVEFRPTVSVASLKPEQAGTEGPVQSESRNTRATVTNEGMDNTRGVKQTIQIGGDMNSVANAVEIAVSEDKQNPTQEQEIARAQHQTRLTTGSGANLSVSNAGNSMGVSIHVPGKGSVTQEIRAGQGLEQAVQLTSNLQQIRNVTRLRVRVRDQIRGSHQVTYRSLKSAIRNLQ